MQSLEKLRYPIGKYNPPTIINPTLLEEWIENLASLPKEIAEITLNLSEKALDIPYRPDGWTVRQLIHHLADSHINAYTRVRLTLTEDKPEVRPYFEDRWAELTDAKTGDIQPSIAIIRAIHERLLVLLRTLKPIDFERTYYHPQAQKEFTMAYLLGNYAWHGKHHLAHIKLTLK
jgi:hypothetical protein